MNQAQHKGESRQAGYSLLLAATAMVVVGSTALMTKLPGLQRLEAQEAHFATSDRMQRLSEALMDYARLNRRLPCPANGADDILSVSGSQEVRTGAYECRYGGHPGQGNFDNAVLPWRSLGLQPEDALDEWGHRINYFVYQGPWKGGGTLPSASFAARGALNYLPCFQVLGAGETDAECVFGSSELGDILYQEAQDVYDNWPGLGNGLGDEEGADNDEDDDEYPKVYAQEAIDGPGRDFNVQTPYELLAVQARQAMFSEVGFRVVYGCYDLAEGCQQNNDFQTDPYMPDTVSQRLPMKASGAVFVLVSHGANGYGAFLPDGAQMRMPDSEAEYRNVRGVGKRKGQNTPYLVYAINKEDVMDEGSTEEFDDILFVSPVDRFLTGTRSWINQTTMISSQWPNGGVLTVPGRDPIDLSTFFEMDN